jgi:hypothetical protein
MDSPDDATISANETNHAVCLRLLADSGYAVLPVKLCPSMALPSGMPQSRARWYYICLHIDKFWDSALEDVRARSVDKSAVAHSVLANVERQLSGWFSEDAPRMALDEILLDDDHPAVTGCLASLRDPTSKRIKEDYEDYKDIFKKHGVVWREPAVFHDTERYGAENAWYERLKPRQRVMIFFLDERHPLDVDGPEQILNL